MDVSIFNEYMVPTIVGICLCVGYIIKHWLPSADNRIIPTACAIMGVILAVWMNWPEITPSVILSGLISGLAATGAHQAVTQVFTGVEVKELTE